MNILHVDSGIFVEQSVSRKLSADVVAQLKASNENARVTHVDLIQNSVDHLTAEELLAEEKPHFDKYVSQLQEADVLVIGAPMYNFTIPSQLKAWIDRVLQAGVTFQYTEQGPEGLLKGKKAIIASGRGGVYSTGDLTALDHQESYLKHALAFIGITDVEVVRAEGMNMGDEAREQGFKNAAEQIEQL